MRNYFSIVIMIGLFLLNSYTKMQAQNAKTVYTATEFADKLKELPNAPLLDVRTEGEFAKGHLLNAQNINWNGGDFEQRISGFDKKQPIFVYCLSGGRSAAAANKMRALGFENVLELAGGIMKWRAANLTEVTDNQTPTQGLSRQQFDALLNTDKVVLIDFYAEWCAPCKKMKPYLAEIANEMRDKVVVVRINADDNQALCKELGIEGLPVLQVYKQKVQTWKYTGFIEKEEVLKQL